MISKYLKNYNADELVQLDNALSLARTKVKSDVPTNTVKDLGEVLQHMSENTDAKGDSAKMSARLNGSQLAHRVYKYLLTQYSAKQLQNTYYTMDNRVFDEPDVAFYPDIYNRFKSPTDAMNYLLEEGLPIWLVKSGSNYPLEHFTYRKAELLFDL